MKRKSRRIFTVVLIFAVLIMTGCSSVEESPCAGKWVGITGEMWGITVSVEEVFGGDFEFEVKNNGKVVFTAGETTGTGKWIVDGDQFILKIEGEEMVGTIGEDTITFDDMLGSGVKMVFAKEGTDAMNQDVSVTEEEGESTEGGEGL